MTEKKKEEERDPVRTCAQRASTALAGTRRSRPIREDPAYQELLRNIRAIFEDAKAKGVDLGARQDLLTCRHCGAYEDEGIREGRMVILGNGTRPARGTEFIVLTHKEKRRQLKNGKTRYAVAYEFICGVCGAHQTEIFKEDFGGLS